MKRLTGVLLSLAMATMIFGFAHISTAAQTITATLTGEIRDPNGAAVPGSTIKVTSAETGLVKSTQTNSEGRYTVAFLNPGRYDVTVEKSGFAKLTRQGVVLEISQTASLNFNLTVAGTNVSLEVSADEVPLLKTEDASLDNTIENKLIEDLPSGERSAIAFINLVPGAIDGGFSAGRGESLNENGNAQGPIGSPGNRNFFDSNFSVNGGRSATNDVLLDGVSNTIGDFNGIAISPPQDSVRELKVVAGSYSSEYGRSGGGVVSIATKAGGRRYSGALYEYYQDGSFNANGWQRNRRGILASGKMVLPRLDISRHQYGGAIGGPVFKWMDNNKTFFFFNYEGRRERNPFSREITVPTDRMKTGDLSELLLTTPYTVTTSTTRTTWTDASGNVVRTGQIFDPFGPLVNYTQSVTNISTGVVTTSTVQGRPMFTNNNMSGLPACSGPRTATQACIDPVARRILTYLPSPNTAGLVNNYVNSSLALFNRKIYAGRVDHTFTDAHSVFGRYSWEQRFTSEPNYFGESVAANVRTVRDTFVNFTLNDTYAITPTFVNNVRVGYTRARANQIPTSQGFDPTTLGFPSYLKTAAAILKFPDITIGGGSAGSTPAGELTSSQIGGAGNNQPRDTISVGDTVTFIKGKQTMKFGGEYRIYRFYAFQFFNPTGNFSFNRTFTRGPVASVAPTNTPDSGSSMASFLLGLPTSGSHEAIAPATILHKYSAAFFQYDFRVMNNLVINAGLRWDYETGTEETHGLITNFDLNGTAPVQPLSTVTLDPFAAQLNPNLSRGIKGLLSFVDGPQSETDKKRFAPRFGFAYSLNDKTTIRGGYGLYFVPLSVEVSTVQGTNFSTSMAQSTQTSQVLLGSTTAQNTVFLNDPFPAGLPAVPGTSLGNRTRLGQQVIAVEPFRRTSYTQQWNLVVQRQLMRNTVLDLAYVGGRGIRLPIQTAELNQINPSVFEFARANYNQPNTCGTSACASISAFFNQQVANPFAGLLGVPGSSLNTTTVARVALLRPYPQYTSVLLFRPHWGQSDYHSMQINLQRRFTNGLSAVVNYTWSKSLDTGGVGNGAAFLDSTNIADIYSFKREKSYSTFDVPQRFVASWTYELPIGKGKWLGKNWSKAMNNVLGGWQTSGAFTIQTGTPITVTVPSFTVGGGVAQFRANRLEGVAVPSLTAAREAVRAGLPWFNTGLFQVPADFVFGNSARTYNDLRRDRYQNLNISVIKNIAWAEGRQKLQLRAEFLNAFNWVVFGTPVTTAASGAPNANGTGFGQVRTQGNTPRNMQFVVRYTF